MNMTVKELAAELNVSKQTIHRTIQKRNIGTIADGNKMLLDDTAQKAIKEDLQSKSTQVKTSGNETADDFGRSRTSADDTNLKQERSTDDTADDLRTEYIESLKAQIEDLKADKQFLQDRLAAAEHERDTLTKERDQLTKERQTILAELLSLRGQPKIKTEVTAPPQKPTSELRPQKSQQQPHKRTLSERIRDFFK